MIELIRTNDTVLLSYAEVLLKDAGLSAIIVDQNMSVLEGSIGVLPRRLLIDSDDAATALRVLQEAGLGDWVKAH
ncbi:MAG: DUF2007 domain-containing protein [Hyphomicrobiaceae bacterium]